MNTQMTMTTEQIRSIIQWLDRSVLVEGPGYHSLYRRVHVSVPAWTVVTAPSRTDMRMIVGGGRGERRRIAEGIEFAREIARKRRARRARCLVTDPLLGLMDRLRHRLATVRKSREHAQRVHESRCAGARKAAATRRVNRQYASLPPEAQTLCWEDVEHECDRCSGHGLVIPSWADSRRWDGREVRCPSCRGEGRHVTRERSAAIVAQAYEAMARGDDPVEEIEGLAYRAKAWDGTLTSTWLRSGEIDADRADEIRESCRRRHEETDYDALLAAGVRQEDARAIAS